MNSVDKFLEYEDNNEYTHKILVYPNITYKKNLEKDSYIYVIRNVIQSLSRLGHKFHWTLLTPRFVHSLNYPNVEQVIYDLPSYPNQMRTHFDSEKFLKAIDWEHKDYDIIYSHLPEHTNQIVNVLHNKTNLHPKVIGYCHWYEIPENTEYDKTMFLENIVGTLQMEECGVNSEWLKKLILKKAEPYFSDDTIQKLDEIIQPHKLGIEHAFFHESTEYDKSPKRIIFNHRPNAYTGWNWFIKSMDELWKQRQDFRVYVTLAESFSDLPEYVVPVKAPSRVDYLELLDTMWVGVGCFQKYSAWSVSTTDGLSRGIPYILPYDFCYPEMVGTQYPLFYKTKSDFLDRMNEVLDSDDRNEMGKVACAVASGLLWDNTVKDWFDGWDFYFTRMKKTVAYDKIITYIKENGVVTKKEILDYMKWGVRIPFNEYRNRLRGEKDIKLTKNTYEVR